LKLLHYSICNRYEPSVSAPRDGRAGRSKRRLKCRATAQRQRFEKAYRAGTLPMKATTMPATMRTGPPLPGVQKYLRQLTSQTRGRLLAEIERLQMCGDDTPGFSVILTELRSEFRKNGQNVVRIANPSPYFFQPLEPLLVDRAPESINPGLISRGSLSPIWDWINLNLLPTMARDYSHNMKRMIAANNQHEIQKIANAFQTKVVKYLESTLVANGGVERIRAGLATYTSSPAVFNDLTKMVRALGARDALAELNEALPPKIDKLEGKGLVKVHRLLNVFTAKHADATPFALTIVANHLKTPWQLIHLVTKPAKGKDAVDDAPTPYAIAVSMVLHQIDDKRAMLRGILKSNRVLVAKEILADIDDTERALRARADLLGESDHRQRLDDLMAAVDALVTAEVRSLPGNLHHVLGARGSRGPSFTGRLTSLVTGGAAYCKKLMT
jgi:hypothetical protein